jgi:hypothetical protein
MLDHVALGFVDKGLEYNVRGQGPCVVLDDMMKTFYASYWRPYKLLVIHSLLFFVKNGFPMGSKKKFRHT